MDLITLNKKIKRIANTKAFEIEMYKYIKNELQGVIIFYQKKQLFEDSIGADGVKLGQYSVKGYDDYGKDFSMIYTGDFRDKLKVTVLYRKISITSQTDHLFEMETSPFFKTHDFFGLTPLNLTHLLNIHIKPHMLEWLKSQTL